MDDSSLFFSPASRDLLHKKKRFSDDFLMKTFENKKNEKCKLETTDHQVHYFIGNNIIKCGMLSKMNLIF